MHKPELLAPAGNLEKLKTAVVYGADAVYAGGKEFSLRAGAGNFDREDIIEGVQFAHARKKAVYIAVNVFARNQDFEKLPEYLRFLSKAGVDGIIISDPGMLALARDIIPEMPVHLSTQANTTNLASARFWERLGVHRVVLARELSLFEIREIAAGTQAELEVFVHGAMCISYSGRCLLSNYFTGRDANRGDCAQSCRWRYYLMEEKRPGQYFPVEEDERGSYILSSRELCLIEHLPLLIDAGVRSFKIEGRNKSIHYVATVTKAYREALDAYFASIDKPKGYQFNPEWLKEIGKVSNREYTTGFLFGHPGPEGQNYGGELYRRPYSFVGVVRDCSENGVAVVEQRNKFVRGEQVEIFTPRGKGFMQKIQDMYDEEGREIEAAPHPRQLVKMHLKQPVPPYSILRRPRAI